MSLLIILLALFIIISFIIWINQSKNSGKICSSEKIIPEGQHCSLNNIICNEQIGSWECNGNCDKDWFGDLCTCNVSQENELSDVCNGYIRACQSDGSIITVKAATCYQLTDYMINKKLGTNPNTVINEVCHNSCQSQSCGQELSCECQQNYNDISLGCFATCPAGSAGPNCQYSDFSTCNSQGKAQYDGSCQCYSGYNGPNCQYSDLVSCNNNGSVQYDGTCKCKGKWAGNNCTFDTTDPNTAWVVVCDCSKQSRTCNSQIISYDPEIRAQCAISGFPGEYCAFGQDSYSAGQACHDKCFIQGC